MKYPVQAGSTEGGISQGKKNMSDLQIFQVFGLSIFTVGLGMLSSPEYFKKVLRDFAQSPAVIFICGIMAIVIGYLIIAFNSVWIGADVIITIFGWLALLKGIALILFPGNFLQLSKSIVRKKENFAATSVFCMALGIFFLYLGYFA